MICGSRGFCTPLLVDKLGSREPTGKSCHLHSTPVKVLSLPSQIVEIDGGLEGTTIPHDLTYKSPGEARVICVSPGTLRVGLIGAKIPRATITGNGYSVSCGHVSRLIFSIL